MSKQYVTNRRGENLFTPEKKISVKNEPETPIEDFGDHNHFDFLFENNFDTMRKSLSMNDINTIRDELKKEEFFGSSSDINKRQSRHTAQSQELSKNKFVSMAEAIYHYQRDTPGRFHSTRPQIFRPQGVSGRMGLTIPQSPMLRSKARSRPHHILSQQEKEAMELEELKKFKIKALPIPKSILDGPIQLPEVSKKPATVPEPFNLTEIHKKPAEQKSPNYVPKFKARPAPKHILENPQIPAKTILPITIPITPKIYKKAISQDAIKIKHGQHQKPVENQKRTGPVRPEPFSFERSDELRKKCKEEKIRNLIEEEKKLATLFKAHPLPEGVKRRMRSATTKASSSTTSSENKENFIRFEARPPTVLQKPPFKPVLQPVQLVKPMPFTLTSQKRAAEREKFDKQLKEKEEEMEKLKEQREKEQIMADEKAQAEMRAKLVHHAKPVPAKTAFIPAKSAVPITVPETPKFVRRLKQN